MGAATITRDRFDYVSSMSDSWKRQTLLNLIKVRYGDAPAFLEVSSVITSYAWSGDLNLSTQLAPVNRGDTWVGLGANAHYEDRPTITYAPLIGEAFARVGVRYREHWFWIDDRDAKSKLTFNYLMMMFSLTETTGSQQAAPVVTVPTR